MTLYLVRHAMPQVDPDTDPATWSLGADGRAAARRLGRRLPPLALLVASDEPKAWQTLDPGGERGVLRDARLREVRRTEEFHDDFRRMRRSYVSGTAFPGWEPQFEVARRFAAAVGAATDRGGGRDVVVASHGMAMTVWLAQTTPMADPGSFWADLQFPDLLVVDLEAGTVTRPDAGLLTGRLAGQCQAPAGEGRVRGRAVQGPRQPDAVRLDPPHSRV